MKSNSFRIALVISMALNLALLLPMLVNDHLSFTYRQTLAHYVSKIFPPRVVFLGDSIMAGGHSFNDPLSINLGSNGLSTYQIAASMSGALAYHPRHIVVMAGTNDVIRGAIDSQNIEGLWEQVCADPHVIVTLAPPTRNRDFNVRLEELNGIVRRVCSERHRPIIGLEALGGPDGLLQPQYSFDGVHMTPVAYRIWRAELNKLGI